MLLWFIRLAFILMIVATGMSYAEQVWDPRLSPILPWLAFGGSLALAAACILVDILIPHKSISAVGAVLFGLIVGLIIAYGLGLIVDLLREAFNPPLPLSLVSTLKVLVGIICSYLAISFVWQTKDDFRFVIPYVEFTKQTKGARPYLLDTSAIIDGRIGDLCATGILESDVLVPRFVLQELQTIADSKDRLKRNRGRRGLEMLNQLQSRGLVRIMTDDIPDLDPAQGVDHLLVELAQRVNGRIITADYNLNRVAQLRGVSVVNLNDVANALKPVFMPGEQMIVKIIKPGEEPNQGVGYLEDGTMVVVEGGRDKIGEQVEVQVTSVFQTSAGKMIFARTPDAPVVERRRRARSPSTERPQTQT